MPLLPLSGHLCGALWLNRRQGVAKSPCTCGSVSGIYTKRTTAKEKPSKKGLIIQSPMGGEISPDEILAKIAGATKGERIGKPDVVYVRVDENKAFWVKGKKRGAIDLW